MGYPVTLGHFSAISVQPMADSVPGNFSIKFYRMVPSAPTPVAGDHSAGGTMPMRAFRYCEPMRLASSVGWYIFPPIDFSLVWDGATTRWTFKGADAWYNLDGAQFPNFRMLFDKLSPERVRGFSPQFLGAVSHPGVVQIWSGLAARTSEDWSLLVRPPANLPRTQNFQGFEGIIETDRWFGPLFTNIRLTKTDVPVDFKVDYPLFMVQPVHRSTADLVGKTAVEVVGGLEQFLDSDWDDYHKTIVERVGEKRVTGDYAKRSRKRK